MKLRKAAGFILAGFIALNSTVMSASATTTYSCDVNSDGSTNIADVLLMYQMFNGWASIYDFDEADFDNDGFVTQVDMLKTQYYLSGITMPINSDDTTGSDTSLLNTDMSYERFNATTGVSSGTYNVSAFTVNEPTRDVIGNDTSYEDYSHSGICKIVTNNGSGTGFVTSDNTILTAGHVLKGKKITSIIFYDTDGTVSDTATPIDFSIPTNYISDTYTDYALITVSDDLGDYKSFSMGFALDRAISEAADVSVTGFSSDLGYVSTGEGDLTVGDDETGEIYYTSDATDGESGAPIYADIVYNNTHYNVVVGIHISGDSNYPHEYNTGVRMCPNILNLINENNGSNTIL